MNLMSESLCISMIQSPIAWEDREANLKHFDAMLRRVSGRTDLAVLPETFTTGFSMNTEALGDTMDGITVRTMKDWAARYRMALTGSFIAKEDGNYYNRALFVTPEGEIHTYDKRHLFRMAGEAAHFKAGEKQTIVSYKGWNICLQVCYDLRFPVWSRNVNKAYDLLIYVANWPEVRANVWTTLLPARAMENSAYVCGVNCTGTDGAGFIYRGRSAIYSPKGEKLASAGTQERMIRSTTLHKDSLEKLRTKFPSWMDADPFTIRL
jgi:predicted amidohydrolase